MCPVLAVKLKWQVLDMFEVTHLLWHVHQHAKMDPCFSKYPSQLFDFLIFYLQTFSVFIITTALNY